MAIPTITTITPDEGFCYGEYFITITGTNFRIPNQIPGDETEESVRIYFGSQLVEKSKVRVLSETEIDVRVPHIFVDLNTITLPYSVDIQLLNIDEFGVPIPGEEVTVIDGFSYIKKNLENGEFTDKLWRMLFHYLNSVLPCPVSGKVHIDFDEDPLDGVPKAPDEPFIQLIGPKRLTSQDANEKAMWYKSVNYNRKRLPKAFDYSFDVIGVASNKRILDNLSDKFEETIRMSPRFVVKYDSEDYEIPIWFIRRPSMLSIVLENSNLLQFQAEIVVKGVPAMSDSLVREFDVLEDVHIIY